MEDKCYIKILKKITNEEFKKIYKSCENKPSLDITLQDLGFCIKHELSDEEQARLEEEAAEKQRIAADKAAEKAAQEQAKLAEKERIAAEKAAEKLLKILGHSGDINND